MRQKAKGIKPEIRKQFLISFEVIGDSFDDVDEKWSAVMSNVVNSEGVVKNTVRIFE